MKKQLSRRRKVTTWVATALLAAQLPIAQAGMVSTEQAIASKQVEEERSELRSFVEREDVRKQLEALGVSPAEAENRVNAMTDAEVMTIAGKMDSAPAGGALSSNDWILILVIALLLVIAL